MVKSIVDLSWQVTEKEYRKGEETSYSLLSSYDREGVKAILNLGKKIDSEALRFGSLTDVIITEPEELDNRFLISEFNRPTNAVLDIILDIYNETEYTLFSDIPEAELLSFINKKEYQKNWKDATRISKISTEGSQYFDLINLTGDKTLMTNDDYNRALSCVEVLKTHPWTSKYFEENGIFSETESHYQLKFKITPAMASAMGIKIARGVRCMFDRIIVDHTNKTIQPIDLKTTGKKEDFFADSFTFWRYDLQATMYWFILFTLCKHDEYFKDFRVLPFKFICINRWSQTPLIWTYRECNVFKTKVDSTGKVYKPWTQLLEEVNWYLLNKKYDYSYESYIALGERVLTELIVKND